MDENQPQGHVIMLDGTYGPGTMCEVTVYTKVKDSEQMKEETFEIPFLFLDMGKIVTMHSMNLYAGYKIISASKPSQLKELGL